MNTIFNYYPIIPDVTAGTLLDIAHLLVIASAARWYFYPTVNQFFLTIINSTSLQMTCNLR